MSRKQLLTRRLVCLEFEQQHKLRYTQEEVGGYTAVNVKQLLPAS